ncbi:hypothetical protein FNV43_RR07620 [Rhamnella rubrinervis]|uniref:Uncharacterized protein n=1 Tax=Rhamnella rubrinervis TaxID=2594499 RepID=A0A8K0HFR4_9ROSA|nr:hypothetical protein FNV43_RR07620 [Rhamnella rubrinervis]
MENNKDLDIEESIAYVRGIVEKKKEELLEHVLMDYGLAGDDHHLPKPCKHLHLSCLKVFNMFFNSSNKYDSNTEMLDDIIKAIYSPLQLQSSNTNLNPPLPLPLETKSLRLLQSLKPNLEPLSLPPVSSKSTKVANVMKCHFGRRPSRHLVHQLSKTSTSRNGNYWKLLTAPAPKFSFCMY